MKIWNVIIEFYFISNKKKKLPNLYIIKLQFLLVHLTHFSHFLRLSADVDVCRRTQRIFFSFYSIKRSIFILSSEYKKGMQKKRILFYNFIEAFIMYFLQFSQKSDLTFLFFCKTNCKWGEKLNWKKKIH